jgi:hypothetical protein
MDEKTIEQWSICENAYKCNVPKAGCTGNRPHKCISIGKEFVCHVSGARMKCIPVSQSNLLDEDLFKI